MLRSLTPPRPLVVRLVVKTVLLWMFVRAVLGVASQFILDGAGTSPILSVGVIAFVCLLLFIDMRILGDRVFLANLGVGDVVLLRFAGIVLVVCEVGWTIAEAGSR